MLSQEVSDKNSNRSLYSETRKSKNTSMNNFKNIEMIMSL